MTNLHCAFEVRIRTMAPAILSRGRLTLDGLLSAAVYAETGLQAEQTYDHIPLARTEGIFHGSSIFARDVYRTRRVTRTGMVNKYSDFRKEELLDQPDKIMTQKKLAPFLSPVMNHYQGIEADELIFFGYGDADQVQRLFSTYISHLGSGHNRGYGAIDTVQVDEIDEDLSLMLEDASPARPIPLNLWTGVLEGDARDCLIIPHAWRAPYWQTPEELCVVPDVFSLSTRRVLTGLAA